VGAIASERAEAARASRRMRIGFQIVVLGLVSLLVFALVFPTARLYLAQREETARLEAEVAAAQARAEELNSEVERWNDPAYVRAQARERLGFVVPGDRSYRVVDPENAPELVPEATPQGVNANPLPGAADDLGPDPWYTTLWESTVAAGAGKLDKTDSSKVPVEDK
jgi:cell division protein FtsB